MRKTINIKEVTKISDSFRKTVLLDAKKLGDILKEVGVNVFKKNLSMNIYLEENVQVDSIRKNGHGYGSGDVKGLNISHYNLREGNFRRSLNFNSDGDILVSKLLGKIEEVVKEAKNRNIVDASIKVIEETQLDKMKEVQSYISELEVGSHVQYNQPYTGRGTRSSNPQLAFRDISLEEAIKLVNYYKEMK
jgi:hypothetical protein